MVLREDVSLAYARHLFDCGNVNAAYYYCDRADEKGEMLRKERRIKSIMLLQFLLIHVQLRKESTINIIIPFFDDYFQCSTWN
jgi:hypothetical protein